MTSDFILRLRFITQTVSEFCLVLPFATPYLCEMGFTAVASLKTNDISNPNIEHDLSLVVSSLQPHFKKMCRAKKVHWSFIFAHIELHCYCKVNAYFIKFFSILEKIHRTKIYKRIMSLNEFEAFSVHVAFLL